jgi:hypothetical protein
MIVVRDKHRVRIFSDACEPKRDPFTRTWRCPHGGKHVLDSMDEKEARRTLAMVPEVGERWDVDFKI